MFLSLSFFIILFLFQPNFLSSSLLSLPWLRRRRFPRSPARHVSREHRLPLHRDAPPPPSLTSACFHLYQFDCNLVKGKISYSVRRTLDQPLNYARIYLADLLFAGVRRIIYFDSDLIGPETMHVLEINLISGQGLQVPTGTLWRMQTYAVAWVDRGQRIRTRVDKVGGEPGYADKLLGVGGRRVGENGALSEMIGAICM